MAGRKLDQDDVKRIFKTSCKLKIAWNELLSPSITEWLQSYEMSTNCSKDMIFPALISLTSAICGPNTTVSSNDESFVNPLNTYNFVISVPGGGKSNTYNRVVEPVLEYVANTTGKKIALETYTTAGIHNHQNQSGGYGIITGDEGERFLTSIASKQKNGESERALLNKMWMGKGDFSTLSSGQRGFLKTSMSACIFIQPQILMQELLSLNADDGLMDRFLFFPVRPMFNQTQLIKEGIERMKLRRMKDFVPIFKPMFEDHADGVRYSLDDSAQILYNQYTDSYARYIEEQYNSDSGKTVQKLMLNALTIYKSVWISRSASLSSTFLPMSTYVALYCTQELVCSSVFRY